MLAAMHFASDAAYGVVPVARDDLLGEVADGLVALGIDGLGGDVVEAWTRRCRDGLDEEIATVRVHGNLHLGQLLRSDQGWLILDFEGAPLLPTAERRRPRPVWFDVSSMLRSFDYVAAMTRAARVESELGDDTVEVGAAMWVERNTRAFLDGYRKGRTMSSDVDIATAVEVGEVARAAYEVAYERANRPELESIPVAALRRLVTA
jgi:maltokinase